MPLPVLPRLPRVCSLMRTSHPHTRTPPAPPQPLLRKYNEGGMGLQAFGLPAVQAVIGAPPPPGPCGTGHPGGRARACSGCDLGSAAPRPAALWPSPCCAVAHPPRCPPARPVPHTPAEHKWAVFARRMLLGELAVFGAWLAAFFAFTVLFQVGGLQERAGLAGGCGPPLLAPAALFQVGRGCVDGPALSATSVVASACSQRARLPPHVAPNLLPRQDEPEEASLAQLLATRRGVATVAAELVALAAMAPFVVRPPSWRGRGRAGGRAGRDRQTGAWAACSVRRRRHCLAPLPAPGPCPAPGRCSRRAP